MSPLRTRNARVVVALVLGLGCASAIGYAGSRYRVAFDRQETLCDDYRVALIDTARRTDARGARVAVAVQGVARYPDGTLLGKQIRGVAGDRVHVGPTGVFVNGERLGELHPAGVSAAGLDATSVARSYVLQPGEIFLFAPGERSFDSRYFGPARSEWIVGELVLRW